jgi:hypothetical protein
MTTDSAAEVDVARSITVPLGQAKAFDLFTARMTEFWPPEHSIGASPVEAVVRYGEQAEQMRAIFDSPGGWTDTVNRCARLADSE